MFKKSLSIEIKNGAVIKIIILSIKCQKSSAKFIYLSQKTHGKKFTLVAADTSVSWRPVRKLSLEPVVNLQAAPKI